MFDFDTYAPKSEYEIDGWVPFQELEGLHVRFLTAWIKEGNFGPEATFIAAVSNGKAVKVVGSSTNNTLLRNKLARLIDLSKTQDDVFPADGLFIKEASDSPKAKSGFFWNLINTAPLSAAMEKKMKKAIADSIAAAKAQDNSGEEVPKEFPDDDSPF